MIELTGRVIQQQTAKGSKSERQAVFLETATETYLLRRQNGHPLADPELERLVGKSIRAKGTLAGALFIMTEWSEP